MRDSILFIEEDITEKDISIDDFLIDDLILIIFSYLKLSKLVHLRLLSRRYKSLIDNRYNQYKYKYYIMSVDTRHYDYYDIKIMFDEENKDRRRSDLNIALVDYDSRRLEDYVSMCGIIKIFDQYRNMRNEKISFSRLIIDDRSICDDRNGYHNEEFTYLVFEKRGILKLCNIFEKNITYILFKNNEIEILKFFYFLRDLYLYSDLYKLKMVDYNI